MLSLKNINSFFQPKFIYRPNMQSTHLQGGDTQVKFMNTTTRKYLCRIRIRNHMKSRIQIRGKSFRIRNADYNHCKRLLLKI
jgi:hypothetical protein